MAMMKDQLISWLNRHRLLVVLTIIFIPFLPVIIGIPFVFGVVAIFSEAMLTALIEAEATILGFFGLIFVYALTSLDNRTDMLNTAWFELRKDITPEYPPVWVKAVENVAKNKKKLVTNSLVAGIFLVVSLLLAILALGFPTEDWVLYLTTFSVGLLFSSLLQIFWTIYDLGKDPAQSTK
jgi:hypothetical protein